MVRTLSFVNLALVLNLSYILITSSSASQSDCDAWVYAIRSAKAGRLASFQVTHPDTTLASSNSKDRIRRALQALPHDPTDSSTAPPSPSSKKVKPTGKAARRGKVDHFVPAIWVPDQKTETCMRCNSRFGWRRRRHHCQLCRRRSTEGACRGKSLKVSESIAQSVAQRTRRCRGYWRVAVESVKIRKGRSREVHLASTAV